MGCIIIQPLLAHCVFFIVGQEGLLYTSTWGFQRCSFRLVGQCEGLSIVERAAGLAPRFYLYKFRTTKNFKRILWEPLCKDFTRMRRNLKRKWLLLLFVVTGVFGLTACSDDYEPWELLTAELTSTLPEQPNLVPWDGGTFTINVKTNGAWDMVVPDWMSVDQKEGHGDAVVNATIMRNQIAKEIFNSEVIVNFIGVEQNNVVGKTTKTIPFGQEGVEKAFKITDCNAKLTKEYKRREETDGSSYNYYQCGYKITYNIENPLTDKELDDIITGVYLYLYIDTPGYPSNFHDTYYLSKTDLAKGKHVLEKSNWRMYRDNYGDYLYLYEIAIAVQTKYGAKVICRTSDIQTEKK